MIIYSPGSECECTCMYSMWFNSWIVHYSISQISFSHSFQKQFSPSMTHWHLKHKLVSDIHTAEDKWNPLSQLTFHHVFLA